MYPKLTLGITNSNISATTRLLRTHYFTIFLYRREDTKEEEDKHGR
jgi:hypothetical protein